MMNELTAFEKLIKKSYQLPEKDPVFFDSLETKLKTFQPNPSVKAKRPFYFSRGWAFAMITLLVISILMLSFAPINVWAQIKSILGFIPGIGLVDTSSPFRQLAEPVSETINGNTITIESAFLSADQTIITYEMSEIPNNIKRAKFGDPECTQPASLILPDGSRIESTISVGNAIPDGSFLHEIKFLRPFPLQFNQAILDLPCLEGTARNKGPQNVQIFLKFKLAPNDNVIYPVTLIPSQIKVDTLASVVTEPENKPETMSMTSTPTIPPFIVDGDRQVTMTVLSVVEKPDSYWVTWVFPDKYDMDVHSNGQLYEMPFNAVLYDANGKELPEPDQGIQAEIWKYEEGLLKQLPDKESSRFSSTLRTFEISKAGVAFPIYAKQNVYERSFPEKEAYADIEFNGSQVLASVQPFEINKVIQIGSLKFKLISIGKSQYGGYTFNFDGQESKVITAEVDLVGHNSNFHGSVSFTPQDPYHFAISVMYPQIPTGKLAVRVSLPAVLGDKISFIGTWSPDQK